jgi:hypothetical protein
VIHLGLPMRFICDVVQGAGRTELSVCPWISVGALNAHAELQLLTPYPGQLSVSTTDVKRGCRRTSPWIRQ